ncbi:hypothetical protein [Thiocystis violascens]|uniref:Uncharacterized protein n=1 Tax=Thiocystis violascens (strain ATCC 17096 / DSM 198 / 6111) TaxID=765911 RepID=I3YF09_THIV6|nr:hypothetical protein [Thiocystis violascens]AFL75577.1 hypothetical protein Thivi_3731 [Thiocystis violascens DSM 198]
MNMIANRAELNAILQTTATIAANRMFYACEHMRCRLDNTLNHCHRKALGARHDLTLSWESSLRYRRILRWSSDHAQRSAFLISSHLSKGR